MTALVVVLVTLVPVLAGAYAGWRQGGRRMAISVASLMGAASIAGVGVSVGWSWPFGLLTPFVAAVLAIAAVAFALRRYRPPVPSRRERAFGAVVGTLAGTTLAASLWLAAAIGEGVVAPAPETSAAPGQRGFAQELVRTANRGFVRHLPWVGELGDEVEATVAILNSSEDARRRLAEGRQWQQLAELPSYQALLEDEEVERDLESVRNGSVLALYRLQRNPHVVAFMREPTVQEMIPDLRPSVLVKEIEGYETGAE
ncbi:MAG: hypothetical protein AAGD14_02270 [Planctomycetota bacterium]